MAGFDQFRQAILLAGFEIFDYARSSFINRISRLEYPFDHTTIYRRQMFNIFVEARERYTT